MPDSNEVHTSPLIMRGGKPAQFLTGSAGTVLGVEEDAAYTMASISLGPGDTIYLYTDGVTEAFASTGEMFSEERLQKEVSARRREPPAEMAENVLREVRVHAKGVRQSDDITLVVLRYLHPGAPAEGLVT